MAQTLSIGMGWATYMARVVPPGAPPTQIIETRRAFYGGAAYLMGILDVISEHDVSEDSGVDILEQIHEELRAYVKTIGTAAERV